MKAILIFLSSILICFPVMIIVTSHLASDRNILSGKSGKVRRIAVMGAAANGTSVSPEFGSRLKKALDLSNLLDCDLDIFGFEPTHEDVRDAIVRYVRNDCHSNTKLNFISGTENTRKSVIKLKELGQTDELDDCIIVSSNYHAFRIKLEARKRNCRITTIAPSHSPESSSLRAYSVRVATETVACLYYLLPVCLTDKIYTGPNSMRQEIPNKFIRYLLRN